MRRFGSYAAVAALLVAVAAVAFWAGNHAVLPPEVQAETHEGQTYRAVTGTVARLVRTQVTASWPTERTYFASGSGVLTSVGHRTGEPARSGDVIATVDLEPVVVASGSVPMFRTLESGVRGLDVAQLQRLLIAGGFLEGPADGEYGPTTRAATLRWQASVGATADGTVGRARSSSSTRCRPDSMS